MKIPTARTAAVICFSPLYRPALVYFGSTASSTIKSTSAAAAALCCCLCMYVLPGCIRRWVGRAYLLFAVRSADELLLHYCLYHERLLPKHLASIFCLDLLHVTTYLDEHTRSRRRRPACIYWIAQRAGANGSDKEWIRKYSAGCIIWRRALHDNLNVKTIGATDVSLHVAAKVPLATL